MTPDAYPFPGSTLRAVVDLTPYGRRYAARPQDGPIGRHRIADARIVWTAGELAGAQLGDLAIYATAPHDGRSGLHDWRISYPARTATLRDSGRLSLPILTSIPERPDALEYLRAILVQATIDAIHAHEQQQRSTAHQEMYDRR